MAYQFELFVDGLDFDFGVDFDALASSIENDAWDCELGGSIPEAFTEAFEAANPGEGEGGPSWYTAVYNKARREAERLVKSDFGLDAFGYDDPDEAAREGGVAYFRSDRDGAEEVAEALAETSSEEVFEALSACITAYAAAKAAKELGIDEQCEFDAPYKYDLWRLISAIKGTDFYDRIMRSPLTEAIDAEAEEAEEAEEAAAPSAEQDEARPDWLDEILKEAARRA